MAYGCYKKINIGIRGIAFGIFLTSELPKKPESFCFPLLPVQICPHLDPKIAVFGIANLAYAAEINFTTCDLCLRNPNAIALHRDRFMSGALWRVAHTLAGPQLSILRPGNRQGSYSKPSAILSFATPTRSKPADRPASAPL